MVLSAHGTHEDMPSILIPECRHSGFRLGRHIEHDERSRSFPADGAAALKSAQHVRFGPPLDQGDLGSCTGNAAVGMLMTDPFYRSKRILHEKDAVAVYEAATKLDDVDGAYPPDDTGSTGLAAMKACKAKGWITAYAHAFGLDHALRALVLAPVCFGVNWYEGFDTPRSDGECRLAGSVRGGHEIVADGIDVDNKRVWLTQSWGAHWGGLGNGRFYWSFNTVERLLAEDGDVVTAKP